MKTYDYKKAKQLIEENKDQLVSAIMGMHEDWFWTAQEVWNNGEYKHELPDNADELEQSLIERRRNNELPMFLDSVINELPESNPELIKATEHQIGGLYGSDWATPVIKLEFKDGASKFIEVSNGESGKKSNPMQGMLGCLSGPVQENIQPISKD